MPRSLSTRDLRNRSDRTYAVRGNVRETLAMRDSATVANAERVNEAKKARSHEWTHNVNESYAVSLDVDSNVRDCEYCKRERNAPSEREVRNAYVASLYAEGRNLRANDAKVNAPMQGDAPTRVGTKVSKVSLVDNVLAGDRTENAPTRKVRTVQRYNVDNVTRVIGNTNITLRNGTRLVAIASSPLNVWKEGRIDVEATLYVIATYRHLLSCRSHTTQGEIR